jgi:hypothetical protein
MGEGWDREGKEEKRHLPQFMHSWVYTHTHTHTHTHLPRTCKARTIRLSHRRGERTGTLRSTEVLLSF